MCNRIGLILCFAILWATSASAYEQIRTDQVHTGYVDARGGLRINGTDVSSSVPLGDITAKSLTCSDSSLGISGVAGSTNGNGGAVPIAGGAGNGTGNGGAASITGGAAGATGTGGAASLAGGAATAGAGGAASLAGGAGGGTGAGGAASLVGGASGTGATGNGGNVTVSGGAAASTNGGGGTYYVKGGSATGTGTGGPVVITGGDSGGASGTAGDVTIAAGAANGGTPGSVSLTDAQWSISAAGIATFPHVRPTAYSSIDATVDLTKAQAQSAGYFPVTTASGAVIVQIGEAMDAADIGSVKTFVVTATASTNALSFTADGSGVTSVMAVQGGTGATSSCEDVGDMVRVTITATQKAIAEYFCAD